MVLKKRFYIVIDQFDEDEHRHCLRRNGTIEYPLYNQLITYSEQNKK